MKIGLLILLAVWIWFPYYKTSEVTTYPSHTSGDKCKTIVGRFTVGQHKSILSGVLIDCETQEPLKLGVLKIDGSVFNTDSSGKFHKLLKPGNYLVRAGWPTYEFETINTKLRSGDSLYVVFYLKTDKRPLE
jgi:hypothetical protein